MIGSTERRTLASSAQPAVIVIHGWGGTFAEAVRQVLELLDFEARWDNGFLRVDRRTGRLLRHVLQGPESNPYVAALQKIVLGRLLAASLSPASGGPPARASDEYVFDEEHLAEEFTRVGLPLSPAARERKAGDLLDEARRVLDPIRPTLRALDEALHGERGAVTSEVEARRLIEDRSAGLATGDALRETLDLLRAGQETGGDLDTVASAVFYAHALGGQARAAGRSFRYGVDYSFAFVNYHEGLRRLAEKGPADVYLADLPVDAIPDLEEDVRYLRERGVSIRRFEDHHPWSARQRGVLDRLVSEGLVGYAALSGPPQGEELPQGEARCGAEMVYEAMVAGQPWDCEGARRLRRIAHSEDLMDGRTEEGRLLTHVIRGAVCKLEIVQTLLDAMPADDLAARVRERGWDRLVAERERILRDEGERLSENAQLLTFEPGAANAGGRPVKVLMALAPRGVPGRPRVLIGTATDYFADKAPEADYLFYCYGSSLLQARRVNQSDVTFNLGVLVQRLGTEADGGHSGAAVARPEANPRYPRRLLGRVGSRNFPLFVRYIAYRMEEAGHRLRAVENKSASSGHYMRQGSRRLVLIAALAVLAGLALMAAFPAFRPAAVRRTNADFYPQVAARGETDEGRDAPSEGDSP